jgi:curved DNA-binding protein CbpA
MSETKACPYTALGVPKDATAAAIKTAYRKLALKCHPDKLVGMTDEALKKEKQEEFHKIHSAYEEIGDEEKRAKYDAEVRLEQLKKESLARGGSKVEVKTARYETRTAAPGGASFSAKGPSRYEERRPAYEERKPSSRYEEDRYFEERAHRKYDAYEAVPKSSSRSARPEKETLRSKTSSDRTRAERVKTRDREERRERSGKFVYVEGDSSGSDEKARWEGEYKRRTEEAHRAREAEDARKDAAAARKRAEDRRSYEEAKEPRRHRSNEAELDRQRKVLEQVDGAARYIYASKVEAADPRPSASRSASSRDAHAYDSRSSRRPEPTRRSSARPKDRPTSSGRDRERERDRKVYPDIVEWDDDRRDRDRERERVPPPFKHSSSSPADIHIPATRAVPQRSQTEVFPEPRLRVDTSPAGMFRRSETMPSIPSSQSYRKASVSVETALPRQSSGLRSAEYASSPLREREREPEFSTVPAARAVPVGTTKYYYPTSGGGVTLLPEHVDVANGHRTILREPGADRRPHRSPSPLSRPPIGPNRPSVIEKSPSRTNAIPPPPLGRSATYVTEELRGRPVANSGKLYGEIDRKAREAARRQTSFSPDSISYTQKIGPDDIRWSAARNAKERGEDERERVFQKPGLGRHPTYVY